jgi:hypothetical protein
MSIINIDTNALVLLLQKTKRPSHTGTSVTDQVVSCALIPNIKEQTISTISLVKDGVSSLSKFSCSAEITKDDYFYIPSIARVLGILKFHGGKITITQTVDSLKFKSNNKQTTIKTSQDCKVFAQSPLTLKQWTEKSIEKFSSFQKIGNAYNYVTKDGSKITPMFACKINGIDLFEAFRCGSINGQNAEVVEFVPLIHNIPKLLVISGSDLHGSTTSEIDVEIDVAWSSQYDAFNLKYKGGLFHLFKNINEKVTLMFFDFTKYGQGTGLLMVTDHDIIFQASILD